MSETFDVIVVGGGPAGEVLVERVAKGGLSVALVEQELVGGECSYWGCIPSKTLLRPGDVLAAARRVPGALEALNGGVDAPAAFAQRDYMTSNWSDNGQERWLEEIGATLVRGHGRLAGQRGVDVARNGSARRLAARRAVVVATGSVPLLPPIPVSRTRWLDEPRGYAGLARPRAAARPRRGAVGVELAQAYRRLGSEVALVEGASRLLAREEPFAGEEVREAFEAEGLEVLVEARVLLPDGRKGLTPAGGRPEARSRRAARRRRARKPNTTISAWTRSGSSLVAPSRSTTRAIGIDGGWLYAIGDVNGRAPLTHMGKYHARLAGDAILGREVSAAAGHRRARHVHRSAGRCGRTHEDQAREQSLDVRAVTYGTGDVAGAYTRGTASRGTSKLVVDEQRRALVGATFRPRRPGAAPLGDDRDRRRRAPRRCGTQSPPSDGERGMATVTQAVRTVNRA